MSQEKPVAKKMFFTLRARNVELRPEDFWTFPPGMPDACSCATENASGFAVGMVPWPCLLRSPMAQETVIFATVRTPEVFLNLVTSSERNGVTGTPEYKRTAVRVAKLS